MSVIKFYLNKGKGQKNSRPIMMSYHYSGQRLFYYTGIRIAESHFNQKSQTSPANAKCIDRLFVNNRLTILRNIVGTIHNENIGRIIPVDEFKQELDERFKVRVKKQRLTFISYFQKYIDAIPGKINPQTGRPLSATMPAKYQTAKNTLEAFFEFTNREWDFSDIDEDFFNQFTSYLQHEKKLALNTIGRLIKYIKTVLNDAAVNGHEVPANFRTVLKAKSEDSDQVFLNRDELDKIFNLDLSGRPALQKVRDLFLIGCWSGLRFSDFTRINKESITNGKIKIYQQKTGKPVIVPLIGHAKAIFEKYQGELPEAISSQKFNKHLKTIAELAEINEPVTRNSTKAGKLASTTELKYNLISTHTARRSFATNAYLMGIDPILIMAITGHQTETEFLKYIKVSGQQKAELFEEQFTKAENNEQ